MDTKAIYSAIGTKKKELQKLYDRMSDDLDRYLLVDHTVKGATGKNKGKPLPGVANVTTNAARVWADHALSILNTSFPQFIINGKQLQDAQTKLIRDWWSGLFYSANQSFEGRSQIPIHHYLAFQTCLRGIPPVRAICRVNAGKVLWDILPLDAPSVSWDTDSNGLVWVNVATSRSKVSIKKEYGIDITEDNTVVDDYWGYDNDQVIEIVFIKEKAVKTTYYPWMKELPFVLQPVTLTPQVAGSSSADIKMMAESIYSGCRGDFDEINDARSLLKTQIIKDIKHPIIHVSNNPELQKLKAYPADFGEVVELTPDQDIKDMPSRDNMLPLLQYNMMTDADLQKATVTSFDYGNLNFQMSALALDKVSGQIGKILMPRRKTIEITYKTIFELLRDQFVALNCSADLVDTDGNSVQISSQDLGALSGKYQVNFNITAFEPEGDAIKYQKATSAMAAGVPQKIIDETIMRYDDIDKINRCRAEDMVKRTCPEVTLIEAFRDVKKAMLLTKDEIEKSTLQMKADAIEARLKALQSQINNPGGA